MNQNRLEITNPGSIGESRLAFKARDFCPAPIDFP